MQEFIMEYLQREYSLPNDIDIQTFDYMESGYVDSLGFIHFIATLEDEYNIEFSDEDIQNPDIRTIGGLIKIITDKTKEA